MKRKTEPLGPLALPVFLSFYLFLLYVSSRALHTFLFRDRIPTSGEAWKLLLVGLRFDLATAALFALPLSLALLLASEREVRKARRALAGYTAGVAAFTLFLELSTKSFLDEFGLRPNRLMVEYLIYPREVLGTLIGEHGPELLFAIVAVTACLVLMYRGALMVLDAHHPWSRRKSLLAVPLVAVFCVFAVRGRLLKGKPMGVEPAAFSNSALVGQLSLNSTYSFGFALNAMRFEADPSRVYGLKMDEAEMLARVKKAMIVPAADFKGDDGNPLLHLQRARVPRKRPMNLVIILEESLGAEYSGSYGGLPLTPRLDALTKQGLKFSRLYSTGIRSARGIEAVLSGFLPTPGESTIKLGLSQHEFFTMASLLKSKGYRTSFIYGGDSNFDNMRTFSLNNGFEEILDQRDHKDPVCVGVWGVSDEDTFRTADAFFRAKGDAPFFSLIFTTSNHAPFGFPEGRIELYEQPKETVHNAIKYADWALGDFLEKARKAPYFKDTVFVIVADHNYRNFGADLVPVDKMHIPGLLLGPGVKPQDYAKPMSQVDLMPTALSFLGIDTEHPMAGHDVQALPKEYPGRAILQYEDHNAYLYGDKAVILGHGGVVGRFIYKGQRLVPSTDAEPELTKDAVAHALLPGFLYGKRKYH